MIDEAKAQGGVVNCPNELPIACVKHDGTMWEHEHGDHPDYKFPVYVEFYGEEDPVMPGFHGDNHALIYTYGNIAMTMFEASYHVFKLSDGEVLMSNYLKKGEWRLSVESLEKVKKVREWA
jgi:hypothetical protein